MIRILIEYRSGPIVEEVVPKFNVGVCMRVEECISNLDHYCKKYKPYATNSL